MCIDLLTCQNTLKLATHFHKAITLHGLSHASQCNYIIMYSWALNHVMKTEYRIRYGYIVIMQSNSYPAKEKRAFTSLFPFTVIKMLQSSSGWIIKFY